MGIIEVGLNKRISALLIDYVVSFLIVISVGIVVSFLTGIFEIGEASYGAFHEHLIVWISLFFIFLYYSHVFKKAGQTIGERIMKIRIVPKHGKRISLLSGIVRTLFLAPLLAIIGMFYVSKDPRRTLLDHICLTNTVKVEK